MPVFRSGPGQAPDWCEMESFDIVRLLPEEGHTFERMGKKEKLVVVRGECTLFFAGEKMRAREGAILDLNVPVGRFVIEEALQATTLVRMAGHWGEATGGCGIFLAKPSSRPQDVGDPVFYSKQTNFDSHYHDCDEYWIVCEGRGIAVSEGMEYELGEGDCLVTAMGFHHDLPQVFEPLRAVYFETTLKGAKRKGHLWEHTHGKADPDLSMQ